MKETQNNAVFTRLTWVYVTQLTFWTMDSVKSTKKFVVCVENNWQHKHVATHHNSFVARLLATIATTTKPTNQLSIVSKK